MLRPRVLLAALLFALGSTIAGCQLIVDFESAPPALRDLPDASDDAPRDGTSTDAE